MFLNFNTMGLKLMIFLIIGTVFFFGCSTSQQVPVQEPQQILPGADVSIPVPDNNINEAVITEEPAPVKPSNVKEFTMTARQWSFDPGTITVNKGDRVKLTITSVDVDHGFALSDFKINEMLEPGKPVTVEFVADKTGTFTFYCSVPCGSGHRDMAGKLIVK